MSEVDFPRRELRVNWSGDCRCGHHINARLLDVTKENNPGVWVNCSECGYTNHLTEAEVNL